MRGRVRSFTKGRVRCTAGAVSALAALGIGASTAQAAVTVGEVFLPNVGCGSDAYFQVSSPAAPAVSYAMPSAGVITAWSYQADAAPPPTLRARVQRVVGANSMLTVARSEIQAPAQNVVNTFPSRMSVQAGDVLGVRSSANYQCGRGAPGYDRGFTLGDPAPASTTVPFLGGDPTQLDVSAQLEPDVDRDGFGDETQDFCPLNAAQQTPCPDRIAPETTLSKKPKKKSKSKKAEFVFASEAGATFSCSIDGKPFEACTSPKSYKVKPGTHVFTLFAKDAAGNIDASPVTYAWTARKKPKK